ncbi:hypothetical protein AKO1_007796 [Acrasis kona]|uniref:Nuclear transport factor 2 family protein n=1 Tax=Acrasis kona TaxID=1008807 RepID=A0AAW2YRK7_9EUKA
MRTLLFACVLICTLSFAVAYKEDRDIAAVKNTTKLFFTVFEMECKAWSNLFEVDGVFYHPQAGAIVGRKSLVDFCLSVQKDKGPNLFRQDGHIRVTKAGGQYHVMLEYVYSTVKDTGKVFTNSGYESMIFKVAGGKATIKAVTEFFNRNQEPYEWDPTA